MTAVRAGAAVMPIPIGKLLGIFTHGDFARHFQSDPKVGERLVADLMTLNPVTRAQGQTSGGSAESVGEPSHRRSCRGRR